MRSREGMTDVPGGRVWYRIAGDRGGLPLLVLHGGPGFTSEYVRSLEDLAAERPVVFYDQLGCGRSERPDDPRLWTVERSVAELAAVRKALGLDRLHILGQSWGTMLATEYGLTQPGGITSFIMASPCISIPRWVQDARRLRQALPDDVNACIDRHEASGFTGCPEYQAAMLVYYRRHVCRLDPWPDELERAFATQGAPVYQTMWGPSEFTATGNLREFDRSSRLGELTVPTLWTCGRHDEATPETVAWYSSLQPGSELIVFEASSHLAHLEERRRYNQAVSAWLRKQEQA